MDYKNLFIEYFKGVSKEFERGETSEYTFRSYLKTLIEGVQSKLKLSEENKKISKIGKPDYTCFKGSVKIGYIETKDIGLSLDKELKSEQLERYSSGSIPNIILTNYVRFILYRDKEVRFDVTLFDLENLKSGKCDIKEESVNKFEQMLSSFLDYNLPTIKSAEELAVELSKRAKLLRTFAKEQLDEDLENPNTGERSSVFDFYEVFKELINDTDVLKCVDAYSQTLTYGLFLSRINSEDKINRRTAAAYIPSSIKIIKKIFSNIAGDELPQNLSWIIDEIIDILNTADIAKILSEFVFEGGERYKDPFIHFYEDFLKEYDPAKRKQLGVYYTPEPVVSFITNSINEILKKEFGKSLGFADDSVKSLDFATGTGTFIANAFVLALKEIREAGLAGIEKEKIKNHLLKDFYGFEILVSPYVITHLKLYTLLKMEGYEMAETDKVQVYLTNTLDPQETVENLKGFLKELTQETAIANSVKLREQILVVMGNPPYSVSSSNKSEWITKLMKDYKEGLEERNIQPLDDDYIKFIRFAQWKIEQNRNGIIGLISNNGYIDGLIHRQMRKELFRAFDKIYILNLHGDSRKKETTPNGGKDENVFDIQQGVCIGLFIKKANSHNKKVLYADLYGKRESKYEYLYKHNFSNVDWSEIKVEQPYYFFAKKNLAGGRKFYSFKKITDIFNIYSYGIKSSRDDLVVGFSKEDLVERFNTLTGRKSDEEVKQELKIIDTKTWKLNKAREKLKSKRIDDILLRYEFRPFDTRWIIYDSSLVERDRYNVMKNLIKHDNIALVCVKQNKGAWLHTLVTNNIGCCDYVTNHSFFFPLYTFESGSQRTFKGRNAKNLQGKLPNFKPEFIEFIMEKYKTEMKPEEILYYIYAVLHSPSYIEKYKEFLKIDFPRIPFVDDYKDFKKLSELGGRLVELHIGKVDLPKGKVKFEISGDRKITNVLHKDNKVFINEKQYFDGVSDELYKFKIGSYLVLDKWLKERKGRQLTSSEIEHFIKIVNVLSQTLEIMNKIDKISLG
ncbi:MAG: type ISP restriction/modification enzyme [Candidatus Bathyarchaeia archaeon]